MAKFDWYQTTLPTSDPGPVITALQNGLDLVDIAPARPRNGYIRAAALARGSHVLAQVFYQGNPGVHVMATGSDSPAVAAILSRFEHLPTRVDAAEDWIEPGLFDRLASALITYATENGIKICQQGDWQRGLGRTLYLGASTSVGRLVLYEKGYQIGLAAGGDPNHVRLECRIRPKRNRDAVSKLTPGQVFGSITWIRQALQAIGWDHLQATAALGTIKTPSDDHRARLAMLRQYRRTLENWATEIGGWESLGTTIQEAIEVEQ